MERWIFFFFCSRQYTFSLKKQSASLGHRVSVESVGSALLKDPRRRASEPKEAELWKVL